MSKFDEGVVIGTILSRKKKKESSDSFFQKILKNSTFANEIEIDSKFTFKIALWLTDELPLWNGGIDSDQNIHIDPDGTKSFVFRHRKSLHKFCIAYEDGEPLYASDMEGEQLGIESHGVVPVGTQQNYKWCFFKLSEYASISSITPYTGIYLSFYNGDFQNAFEYSGNISADVVINHYGINKSTIEEMPTVYLAETETRTYSNIGNTLTYPNRYGTYSDMSTKQVLDKYAEIVRHIYIANGTPCREALIVEYEG